MSRGRTRRPTWAGLGGTGLRPLAWARKHAPWLTRAYWPSAKVGLPSFPTLSGKRRASRRERRAWLKQREREKVWAWGDGAQHVMATYERIMTMGANGAETED